MSIVLWLALAFAEEPAAALQGRVELTVGVLSEAAPPPKAAPGVRPAALDAWCPADAPSAVATLPAGGMVAATACSAGLWWTSDEAGGVWRVGGGVPDGVAAGMALLADPDGALVAVVWTTAGDARMTTWRPSQPATFALGVRTLPAGEPLRWPEPAAPGGALQALAQVDTRFPEGVAIHGARLEEAPAPNGAVVFEATVNTTQGKRPARLSMPRPPKLAPPSP